MKKKAKVSKKVKKVSNKAINKKTLKKPGKAAMARDLWSKVRPQSQT